MDNTMKSQVLEILDYWRTIEFLGQTDIPEESPENKSLIEKILKGKNPEGKKADKIEVFHFLETPYLEPEEILEEEYARLDDAFINLIESYEVKGNEQRYPRYRH